MSLPEDYKNMAEGMLVGKEGIKESLDSIWVSVYSNLTHTTQFQKNFSSLDKEVVEECIIIILNDYKNTIAKDVY